MKRFIVLSTFLVAFLFVGCYLHLTNGSFDIALLDVIKTLLRINPNEQFDLVIFEFRLPRIVIAALVGVGLAISGVVLQGITRNGLADPGILGINAGASSAIVIFMFFFQVRLATLEISDMTSILIMPLFGFVGGILAAALIFIFSYRNARLDMARLLLTGIAINSGFGAITMYVTLKMNSKDFESAAFWMSGSISNANWLYIVAMLPWLIIFGVYTYKKAYMLDYFQLEEENIKSLGIALEREKIMLLLASVGMISACVSVSGSISFIGLMAPHIARQLIGGARHKYIMPIAALIGAALLVLSDFIAKTVFAPSELSVGVVVSLIGIPYFLYLLVKAKG